MQYNCRRLITAIFILLSPSTVVASSDLGELINRIEKTAKPGYGISKEEQELAALIRIQGAESIPLLLPLLKHKNGDVRDLVSYTLRDIDGLSDNHLDALIEARLAGSGWIPSAIARIGSQRAIDFLISEISRSPGPQLNFAFGVLGERGIPALVDIYRCTNCDEMLLRFTLNVWDRLDSQGSSGVLPLKDIATNPDAETAARIAAIAALGEIGVPAHEASPDLLRLAELNTEAFGEAISNALIEMKSPEAVPALVRRLRDSEYITDFRDIAELQDFGYEAGAAAIPYLEHPIWENRVGAARTLGFIKYRPAVSALVEVLDNIEDWRLVYVSVESLGRIGAEEAIEPLKHVAKSHWYPPIRIAAKTALKKIRTGTAYESRWHPDNFAIEFFEYQNPDYKPCSSTGFEVKQVSGGVKLYGEEHESKLAALTYTFLAGYSRQNSDGELDHFEYEVNWTPEVALRVENGWLAGVDQGEFGGALLYVPEQGETVIVIDDNVQNIFQIGDDIVVIGGLVRVFSNDGGAYKVGKNSKGQWSAELWRTLPGTPRFSGLVDGDRVLIHTVSGSILLSPDGRIEMATCAVPF